MRVKVICENQFLNGGDDKAVFYEGSDLAAIRNLVARSLAAQAIKTQKVQRFGMWVAYPMPD